MQPLTIFRVLTFILIPIACLFGFLDIIILIQALAFPQLLLLVFTLACFVIYTFASLRFLTRGIDARFPQKSSLRDWIRVNAYVTLFIVFSFLQFSLSFFFSSDLQLRAYFTEAMKMQKNVPPMFTIELFLSIARGFAYFLIFLSLVLIVHIILNFSLLKRYKHLFDSAPVE